MRNYGFDIVKAVTAVNRTPHLTSLSSAVISSNLLVLIKKKKKKKEGFFNRSACHVQITMEMCFVNSMRTY